MDTFVASATEQVWDLPELILKSRFASAVAAGAARYPIHLRLRFAARTDLDGLFDRIALDLGFQAERLEANALLLDSEEVIGMGRGSRKKTYCSCTSASGPARQQRPNRRGSPSCRRCGTAASSSQCSQSTGTS